MLSKALFIYTETSLHAGVGSTVSSIDLPIQRERTTQYPIVQGSGVKGAMRSQSPDNHRESLFGPDSQNGEKFAGSVSFGDARIVLFPVRSLMGVFAYTTCPQVLARLGRDVRNFPSIPVPTSDSEVLVTQNNNVAVDSTVILEEFSFDTQESADEIAAWLAENAFPEGEEYAYWRDKILRSLVILPDNAFRDFVLTSTEIATKVHLDHVTKTVKKGQLWTMESLPADSLLMSNVLVRQSRSGDSADEEAISQWLKEIPERIQIGGNETTGHGFVALKWA